jgi:hypothetical protein
MSRPVGSYKATITPKSMRAREYRISTAPPRIVGKPDIWSVAAKMANTLAAIKAFKGICPVQDLAADALSIYQQYWREN